MENKELSQMNFHEAYNDRFGCCICLGPKLRMVTGHCQHRICEDCLYVGAERRPIMQNCPVCSYTNSFPRFRPVIPTSTVEIQVCLGVQKCPNKGCTAQLWFWEVDEHLKNCDTESEATPNKKRRLSTKNVNKPKTETGSSPRPRTTRSRWQNSEPNHVRSSPTESHERSNINQTPQRRSRQNDSNVDQVTQSSENSNILNTRLSRSRHHSSSRLRIDRSPTNQVRTSPSVRNRRSSRAELNEISNMNQRRPSRNDSNIDSVRPLSEDSTVSNRRRNRSSQRSSGIGQGRLDMSTRDMRSKNLNSRSSGTENRRPSRR